MSDGSPRLIEKKSLVSVADARLFLWDANSHLSNEQVENLVNFAEQFWTYIIELYLAWKLG